MKIRVKITRDRSGRVVTMDLEDYLKGVVPSEIKAETCPMEAQKAQAIAARTYAIRKTIDRRSKPYDVDDTAGYQAYGARPRHRNSDAAVEATRGLVLMYGGKLIDAVYTDSNGGRCVSSLERWGSAIPYLIDQLDPYDNSGKVRGHGVGLSQTGAAARGKAGQTCAEILGFYYPGAVIKKLKEADKMNLDVRLSEHFTLREFYDPANYVDVLKGKAAPIVQPSDIDHRIIALLEKLRAKYRQKWPGVVIRIRPHGGYRPDPLNKLVGGAPGSQHRKGNAADFSVVVLGKAIDAPTLAVWTEHYMQELGINGGVGMYKATDNYIHVDARGKNVAWYDSYSSAGCPGQGGRPCTYRKGSKGAGVVLIQRYLGIPADGKYGPQTMAAVKAWQAEHGCTPDGIFGRETNRKMGYVLPWEV